MQSGFKWHKNTQLMHLSVIAGNKKYTSPSNKEQISTKCVFNLLTYTSLRDWCTIAYNLWVSRVTNPKSLCVNTYRLMNN